MECSVYWGISLNRATSIQTDDRREIFTASYVIPSGFMKRFTGGIGLRGSAGAPISKLGAHPAYDDPGEIPIGGRGTVGRTASNYQLDLHADYPLQLGERYKIKFTFDTFNVTNSRSLTGVNQNIALSYGTPDWITSSRYHSSVHFMGADRYDLSSN